MKKLVALLLALVCVFSLAACSVPGDGNEPDIPPASTSEAQQILDALSELIVKSSPNKTVVTAVTGTTDVNLVTKIEATKGEVSGKEAAIYISEVESLDDIGAYEAKKVVRETKEYVEGLGLRENAAKGGTWNAEVYDNTIVKKIQPYRMDLDASLIKGLLTNEDGTVYTFTVSQENVNSVFAKFGAEARATINSDVSVRIETDGASVTLIQLSYKTKSIPNLENPMVTVTAVYDYSLQSISLLK